MKKALADIYSTNATPSLDLPKPEYGDVRDEQRPRVYGSAKYLNEHLHEAPVMLIPCLEGRPDGAPAGMSASFWGSLLPAVWSFMLALRSRGLGSAWTTLHLLGDGEKQAAELLGIPFDQYSQAGLFPRDTGGGGQDHCHERERGPRPEDKHPGQNVHEKGPHDRRTGKEQEPGGH